MVRILNVTGGIQRKIKSSFGYVSANLIPYLKYVNVAAKKIKITNNNLTTEEIENKLDNGDISMFSTAIIQVGY